MLQTVIVFKVLNMCWFILTQHTEANINKHYQQHEGLNQHLEYGMQLLRNTSPHITNREFCKRPLHQKEPQEAG